MTKWGLNEEMLPDNESVCNSGTIHIGNELESDVDAEVYHLLRAVVEW